MRRIPVMDCGDGRVRAEVGSVGGVSIPKTANYTVLATDVGKLFTNKGAVGTVILTLPAPKVGMLFFFAVVAAQTLTITASGGAKINNSAANGTYSAAGTQAQIGFVEVVSPDGVNWHVLSTGTWTTT